MRRLSVLVATLFLLGAVAAGAASARRAPPPFPKLPAGSWHAEYNVKIGKKQSTLIIDRGRIVQVSLTQMTLLEPDGTRQLIPLSLETIVMPKRLRLTTASLRARPRGRRDADRRGRRGARARPQRGAAPPSARGCMI